MLALCAAADEPLGGSLRHAIVVAALPWQWSPRLETRGSRALVIAVRGGVLGWR